MGFGSFFKKIAGVAAPFAAFIPGAGPFISAGLGALSGLGGGGGKKGKMDPVQAQLLAQIQQQQAQQKYLLDTFGTPSWNKASALYGKAGDMWSGLLDNTPQGKGLQNQLLGPVRDQRASQTQSMLKQMGTQGARGGAQSGALSNLLFKNMGDNNRDLLGLRSTALDKLESVGNDFSSLGASAVGNSTQLGGSAMSGLLGLSGQQSQERMQSSAQNAGMFSQLGQIGGQLLGDWLGNKKKTSSSSRSSGGLGSILGSHDVGHSGGF